MQCGRISYICIVEGSPDIVNPMFWVFFFFLAKANKRAPTVDAPSERPGVRRTAEMTKLYGKGAAMIHGMETAVQMSYDRTMDIRQPKFWPNMPLKIVFS